jgi:hypothetical protein
MGITTRITAVMKKYLFLLLIVFLTACAHKAATTADGQGHGQIHGQEQAQSHGQEQGHGHGPSQASKFKGIPDHYPTTPQQDPSLKGRVYTLSSYYAKTQEDLSELSAVAKLNDKTKVERMMSEGRVFLAPKASSIVVENEFMPHTAVPVIQFKFLHGPGSGFTYKSYIYEFQPDSM